MENFLKFFKSRFFIIALCVALLLSIIPTVLCAMGHGNYVRSAIQTVATPFQWMFTKIGDGFGGYASYFKTIDQLRDENESLRRELENSRDKVYDAELIMEENEYLRSYLGIKSEHADFKFEEATVIGRESTNYRTVYTLSKGTLHGITVNMPVITEDGLVGYIVEVGATWSRAVSLVETASSVGAYVERSGTLGIVEGTYELRFDGLCRMIYIEPDSDIRVGDKVLTSGVGSFYPRGLSVGVVTKIETDQANRTLTATVKPEVDFFDISKVMIITDYSNYSE